MKNLLFLLFVFSVFSCGSKNNNQVKQDSTVNFEGSYDLVGDQQVGNCPASINIIRECDGYILSSNNTNQNEDFCNVNVDRRPPSPDGNKVVVVTQEGNQLTAVVKIDKNVYTNSLTLDDSVYLTKVTDYKSHDSVRCYFEKR